MLDRIATSDLGVETIGRFEDHPLFPEEIQSLGRVVNRRRIEFATGRYCAKKAISWLGVTPSAIVIGDGREPVWPSGIVGSITHCSGYCAAVAAKSSQVLSIGIDADLVQHHQAVAGLQRLPHCLGSLPNAQITRRRADLRGFCGSVEATLQG